MKFALFTGCVARGATRELMVSTQKTAEALGMDFVEMKSAACCGAGVVSEQNPVLADALNARTVAIAEKQNLDVMTICSTCQGNLKKTECKMDSDPEYKDKINYVLKDGGHQYTGGKSKIQHMATILSTPENLELLRSKVKKPLKGLKVASFYGCYILRPSELSDFEDADNPNALEDIFSALGAEPVYYDHRIKCCGFPIIMMNKEASHKMAGNALVDAVESGADVVVTGCPLCHLSLDSYQPEIDSLRAKGYEVPILHLPQLIALAMGCTPRELEMHKHIASTTELEAKLG